MAKSVSRQPKSGSQVIMSDRISELPDSLLQHILSFLPTKQAIATSLLSKRWRPLWRGISTLDVDDLGFQGFQSFAQFVAAVLIVGDLKPLEKFRIFCRQNYSSQGSIICNWTKIWIYAATNRKVEQLELFFPFTFKGIISPPSIFICSTIQRLRLSWVTVDALFHVNLPSLKLMSVCKIRFPDFKCAAMLLSGCPRLEKLALLDVHIHNCNISTALDVGSLQHLASAVFPAFMMTLKAFSGVKILRLCQNIWSPSQDMPTYHNLTFMEFSCYAKDWGSIVRCLKNCPKLQIIRILQALVHAENNWMEPIVVDVPLCISSQLKTFYLAGYQGWNSQFQMVRFIMKEAKVLRTISIRSICSASLENKHQVLNRLSKCPRSSENCKLLFD